MAKIAFSGQRDYGLRLENLSDLLDEKTLEEAVAAGAEVVADAIRANLEALPTEEYRKLQPGEKFDGVPESQKKDLENSFGLTPISRDKNGFLNTKAGFDGYGSNPTAAYPQGLPNQMVARAVESGSSVREKHPFVRPAVTAKKQDAIEAMGQVVDKKLEKNF